MSVHIAFETPKDIQDQVYELVKAIGKGICKGMDYFALESFLINMKESLKLGIF